MDSAICFMYNYTSIVRIILILIIVVEIILIYLLDCWNSYSHTFFNRRIPQY